jgi:histidine triad (HIT) family protein
LLIPKLHIDSLAETDESHTVLLGKLLLLVPKLAKQHGLGSGFRTAIHTGRDGGQEVFHLHLHIIGGGKISHL